jgi:hypothetical protein
MIVDLTARRSSPLFVAELFLSIAALAGCSRGAGMAQVSGRVTFKDGSIPKGGVCVVRFEPTKDTTAKIRKAASGGIQPDGSFVMSTQRPDDGVYCGKYHVTFTVWKAPREPVSLISDEYTNSATTPYHVTVDGDMHDLVFEIEPLE